MFQDSILLKNLFQYSKRESPEKLRKSLRIRLDFYDGHPGQNKARQYFNHCCPDQDFLSFLEIIFPYFKFILRLTLLYFQKDIKFFWSKKSLNRLSFSSHPFFKFYF